MQQEEIRPTLCKTIDVKLKITKIYLIHLTNKALYIKWSSELINVKILFKK